jgi:asparagine synthase (glutamine-hydrolysing)
MCGIVGVFTHATRANDQLGWVTAATDLMTRRGPDDEGFWSDDHLALGFRRLSILDLSAAGHQPMVTSDGRAVAVVNGEIYNFRALRRELEQAGVRFRSSSDSEVALYALRQWGTDALARFDGMYALAYYDLDRRQLLVARDPVGIKPLYVLEHRDGLVFGSQYDQVVRHPWCERQRIDVQALGSFLRLGWVPPPEGLIEGTRMIEPGTALIVGPGEPARTVRFRSFFDEDPTIADRSRANASVDAAVRASVEAQLVSDVPVGVFLSGGIDSPLVAAEAKRSAPDVPSFTIGSDDPLHDESADARRYARAIGTHHVERTLSATEARAKVDQLVQAYSEPFSDFSALPTLLVSELARETVTVALSGDGGDELFWGYPRFAKVADAAPWFRWPRPARRVARQALRLAPARRPPAGIDFASVGEWYLDAHAYVRASSFASIAPEVARTWRPPDGFRYDGPPEARSVLLWMRRNEWRYHLPMILLKVDRASMHHSLEVRVPLLADAMNEVAEQVEPTVCIGGGDGKLPLRAALRARVGDAAVTTGKRGFSAPLGHWLTDELRGVVEASLLDGIAFGEDLFDRREIATMYDQHARGERDHTKALWALLTLQRWADHHLRPLEPTAPRPGDPTPAATP